MGFHKDFSWGAASAAFQIEGGFDADGKGPSIWDVLAKKPGRVSYGENGDVSTDHYHRYREDVKLFQEIGLQHYRFSISWPRVLAAGTGSVNEAGLSFYEGLVDELLAAGIQPMLTLYHWDMPYALYLQGGWKNDASSDWFAEFVRVMVERLGSKVKYWMTFNEPQINLGLGHRLGIHAPFEQLCDEDILHMTKNILLAHGKAVKIIREYLGDSVNVGFSPTGDCVLPLENSPEAIEIARRTSFSLGDEFVMSNSWWGDPIVLGQYPQEAAHRFGEKMYRLNEAEWALVSQPLDFYAFNVYQATMNFRADPTRYDQYSYAGSPRTMSNWNLTPTVLYWAPKFLFERYGLPILITENGMAGMDWVAIDGQVHDPQRIDFMQRYLQEFKKAADEGIELLGYTYWSAMDNLEWAAGFNQRFGLIHVDFRSLNRTLKDSALWYKTVIQTNGENL